MDPAFVERRFARLIHLLDHLSIDDQMALIIHCAEKDFYSVTILKLLCEDATEALKMPGLNLNFVSRCEFFDLHNSIVIQPFTDEVYDFVVDRNRPAADADHILHAPRGIDLINQVVITVRKDVAGEERLDHNPVAIA